MTQGRTGGVGSTTPRDREKRSRTVTDVAAVPGLAARTRPRRAAMPGPAARVARVLYALLASAFVGCVAVQVFLAGMGAFGADWDRHTAFVHVLELLALPMIPAALVGRLSWGLTLLPGGLLVLIGAQYAFANSVVPAAALHPVNALLIFVSSMFAARRAWAAVRKKG